MKEENNECPDCDGTGNGCELCMGDCFDGPNKLCSSAGEDFNPCETCGGSGILDDVNHIEEE